MIDFLYPLSTVVLNFICLLLCVRFIFTRRPVWILPMLLSLALLVGSVVCLLATASNVAGETISTVASYASLFLFGVGVLWTITIIGLETVTRRANHNDRKALAEAEYIRKSFEQEFYAEAADPRPTAVHRITPSEAVELATTKTKKKDLYLAGPIPTVQLRKTSFVQSDN